MNFIFKITGGAHLACDHRHGWPW